MSLALVLGAFAAGLEEELHASSNSGAAPKAATAPRSLAPLVRK